MFHRLNLSISTRTLDAETHENRHLIDPRRTPKGFHMLLAPGDQWGMTILTTTAKDSPCLKLRPCSKMPSSAGMLQIGVDTYGGGVVLGWPETIVSWKTKHSGLNNPKYIDIRYQLSDREQILIILVHMCTHCNSLSATCFSLQLGFEARGGWSAIVFLGEIPPSRNMSKPGPGKICHPGMDGPDGCLFSYYYFDMKHGILIVLFIFGSWICQYFKRRWKESPRSTGMQLASKHGLNPSLKVCGTLGLTDLWVWRARWFVPRRTSVGKHFLFNKCECWKKESK